MAAGDVEYDVEGGDGEYEKYMFPCVMRRRGLSGIDIYPLLEKKISF